MFKVLRMTEGINCEVLLHEGWLSEVRAKDLLYLFSYKLSNFYTNPHSRCNLLIALHNKKVQNLCWWTYDTVVSDQFCNCFTDSYASQGFLCFPFTVNGNVMMELKEISMEVLSMKFTANGKNGTMCCWILLQP